MKFVETFNLIGQSPNPQRHLPELHELLRARELTSLVKHPVPRMIHMQVFHLWLRVFCP